MNLLSTLKDSMLENFFPQGWDLERIDQCAAVNSEALLIRQPFWHQEFQPLLCEDVHELEVMMGHAIAREIEDCRLDNRQLCLILPAGPMGMYRWVVYFLKEWRVNCSHVYGFNMDEWSDAEGNTLLPEHPGSFQYALEKAFYQPLGAYTVPVSQRYFATKEQLPRYREMIARLKQDGAKLVTVFGIGRAMHIAFWEPHFAEEYESEDMWRQASYRIGAKLHPLTIEQNAITSFKSRTTLVPCRANTIGPGLFLQSDSVIGGCDGTFGRGMQWQGLSVKATLRYGPDRWLPSTYMPTLPGKLFVLRELTDSLEADVN